MPRRTTSADMCVVNAEKRTYKFRRIIVSPLTVAQCPFDTARIHKGTVGTIDLFSRTLML
jgi:hypothetical protein